MFVKDKDGDYQSINVTSRDDMRPALPPGAYQVGVGSTGMFFKPVVLAPEPFVKLDTSVVRKVMREVDEFFNPDMTARLAAAGIKHRRGIIIYGPPGTGKTSLVRSLFPVFAAQNAVVVVDVNADHLENLIIPAIRRNDPDRPIVLFFDEFDKNANYSRNELLTLLDGINSPDHLLTIGCTNYIDKIPTQLRSRPSRFGLILELAALDRDARAAYVAHKYPMLSEEMRTFVIDATVAQPLDYVEEGCKLALMGHEPDELRDRITTTPASALVGVDDDEDE